MDQIIFTIALDGQPIPIRLNFVLAVVLVLLIFRYQRKAADEYKKWAGTRSPVAASLKESKSAFDAMYDGTSGCIWSLGERVLIFLLWIIVADLVLAGGAYSRDILQILFSGG